jgi:hypothetical protein
MPHGDHSADTQTGNAEVRIGDYWYPILGGVSEQPLARWPPKVTFGDYAKDSDPLVSAYVMGSFTGGIGNFKIKAGVEDDTYWTGTLETRYPEGPTLLPLSEPFGSDNDDYDSVLPLGDFPAADPTLLVAFDADLHSWNAEDSVFEFESALAFTPVDRGVEFQEEFWIPFGADGYTVLDNTLTATDATDIHPIQFIVWDKKLMALTTEGHLRQRDTVANDWFDTEWATSGENRTLPSGNLPRRMVNFINASGVPTLHVVTNNLVFAYDKDGDELYETKLDYPRHPDQGRAAANWRGDFMFVNVGLGIHGYNGSIITAMGPDGRHGLPAHLRGTIVDLVAEYNALLALIQGNPNEAAAVTDEGYVSVAPLYGNQDTWAISGYPYLPTYSSIYRWSNSQWHPVWESPDATGFPTLMYISQANEEYNLWWGYGNQMYRQRLPVDFQNPKQSLLSQSRKFSPSGNLITGWFDADMTAFYKLASHIEVNMEDVTGLGDTGGSVTVSYQIDDDTAWRNLGTAQHVGRTNMTFANEPREVGNPFSRGRSFRRIRFRIAMNQRSTPAPEGETEEQAAVRIETDKYTSPLTDSIVFKFHKVPEQSLSWQFVISLTHEDGYKGVGNETLVEYLYDRLVVADFFEFGYRNEVFRVRSAQSAGDRGTGWDDRGNYNVNIVEVRTGPDREGDITLYVDSE